MSFDEKVEFIKKVAFDKAELMRYVKQPNHYEDSIPCDLDTDFDELRLVNTLLFTNVN